MKFNDNISAQIERAAKLLREAASKVDTERTIGNRTKAKSPGLQELVDTAASLEALVKRAKRK